MSFKQCIWRGNGIFLSIIVLMSLYCFGADESGMPSIFCDERVDVLEHVYDSAPFKVHLIVNSLLGKEENPYEFNYALFNGRTGVGKSTLGIAVAYKLKWKLRRFSARDFIKGENRNATATAFNTITEGLADYKDNLVLVIDEINHLLMNYDSKHHDTDTSSMSLWTLLDEIKHKRNIFLIGTTNGIGGFPPQVLERLEPGIIKIMVNKDPDYIRQILLSRLSSDRIVITEDTINYLQNHIETLEGYSSRNIISLASEIRVKAREDAYKKGKQGRLTIEPEHIQMAIASLAEIREEAQQKPYKDTEFDQRERHHKEMLEQGQRLHAESMKLQNDSMRLQEQTASDGLRANYVGILASAAIGAGSTAAGVYFSNKNHIEAMAVQRHGNAVNTAIGVSSVGANVAGVAISAAGVYVAATVAGVACTIL